MVYLEGADVSEFLSADGMGGGNAAVVGNVDVVHGEVALLRVWCVAVCCSVLQCVAVCSSVLQCVAVCCSGGEYRCGTR